MPNRGAVALEWLRDGYWRDIIVSFTVSIVNFTFLGFGVAHGRWFNAALAFVGGTICSGTLVFTTLVRSRIWWATERKTRRQEFQANLDAMWLEGYPRNWRTVLQPNQGTGDWVVIRPLPPSHKIPADVQTTMNKMLELLAPSIRR